MINKIVLNIPHSSAKGILDNGWGNDILPLVQRWTDWQTDYIFGKSENPQVIPIIFPFSRFVVDVERLENDPLEEIGQGIIYRSYDGVNRGSCDDVKLMNLYHTHIRNVVNALSPSALLIDCHSFPSDLSPDVDICIGFNEDWSKPSTSLLTMVKQHFELSGYKVAYNFPYSNSLSPIADFSYPSLMIELNKSIYDSEYKMKGVNVLINDLYKKILED